jgi:hypothetical protein
VVQGKPHKIKRVDEVNNGMPQVDKNYDSAYLVRLVRAVCFVHNIHFKRPPMKTIVKILLEIDVPDDLAARRKFREAAAQLAPHFPADAVVRDFKIVEDGTGRPIDKWDGGPVR